MFDPMVHNEVPPESSAQSPRADQRWIHIRRPTIVAGGELTLENLDFGGARPAGLSRHRCT